MKTNCLFLQFFWFFFWSQVTTSSGNFSSGTLRISTRHFAPYMYQDSEGDFYKGVEFEFLHRMAEMLNVSLHFQVASNHSDICYDLAMNVADICIGGIFPTESIFNYAMMSVTYASDDLIWCVQQAGMMPRFLAQLYIAQAPTWFMVIFGYGYLSGFLLYFLVQFDLKYKRRNNCDWHQTTWLVTMPAVVGHSPNFQPRKGTIRIFFAFILITAFFLFQILLSRGYNVLHIQKQWHQVSSFDEIIEMDFQLVGSRDAFNLLNRNKMIPNRKIKSFNVCEDISECLVHGTSHKDVAIGGSRHNMIKSKFSSQMFCFDGFENIVSYPIGMYMRKDFALKAKVNEIVHQLLESGFFVKWQSDSQVDGKHESPNTEPLQLAITHVSAALVFLIGCGSVLSTSAFVFENIIYWKMQKRQENRHNIWMYLEQFFDGQRNYFKNVPQRLQEQNKNAERIFPYLD